MGDQIFEALKTSADSLLLIDDTGDPAYRDPVNPIFGLGGCAVLARDLVRVIREPWAAVRTAVAGSSTAQIHATRAERRMNKTKENAIRSFFIEQQFMRLAYVSSAQTQYARTTEIDDVVIRSTAAVLLQRILEVAKWTPFSSIVAIFEDNPYLRPRLEAAPGDLQFEENGRVIPHEWCIMSKSAREPGLEVADFMMHTIAGYCRSGRDPQSKFAARFSAIFGTKDERLCSFMEGGEVAYSPKIPRSSLGARE
jgi:Protein of unknown function (DUF3800)